MTEQLPALVAGDLLVRPLLGSVARQHLTHAEDRLLAETDAGFGALRVLADGDSVAVRVELDGSVAAELAPVVAAAGTEGPVVTSSRWENPLRLGRATGTVRFVTAGAPRLAGRRRYLLVRLDDGSSWTYGASQTMTDRPSVAGRLLGSGTAAVQLRRGDRPQDAPVGVGLTSEPVREGKELVGLGRLTWPDGTRPDEVLLALLLWLGTDEFKLDPLWMRMINAGNH